MAYRPFLYMNAMNYDQDILLILNEAGAKGLHVSKIARHVFNQRNGLFDTVSFDEVRHYVSSFLNKSSKRPNAVVEKMNARGFYRINHLSGVSRQLMFDFREEEPQGENNPCCNEDRSLSLF